MERDTEETVGECDDEDIAAAAATLKQPKLPGLGNTFVEEDVAIKVRTEDIVSTTEKVQEEIQLHPNLSGSFKGVPHVSAMYCILYENATGNSHSSLPTTTETTRFNNLPTDVMFQENEDEIMKASSTCSDGSLCRRMFASFVRAKKPGSHGKHLHGVHTLLLVILLAAQASCDETSAAPSITTTNAQMSVNYFVVVTVDTNEQKEESEISAWLTQVFQNELQKCVSSIDEELIANSPSNETMLTTTATTTLQSFNTTTAVATTTLQNTTTTAETTTLQSNNTTTAAATTLQSNNTTTAATTMLQSNNTTTAAATMLQSNNTTTAAATTLQSNNTTTAAATTLQSNNTTTAAATMLQSNNTTTAAATTLQSNNTTTAAATTLQSNNTTTAAATMLQSNNTTTAAATTLQSNNTTTAAATMLQSNNTTTAAATTLQSNNTTTAAATMLQSNNTTTAAATTLQSNNTTTTKTTTTTASTVTTTPATTTPVLENTTTTTPAATALRRTTTTTPAATALRRTTTTTPTATALRRTTTTTPAATALRRTTTTTPAATALRRTTTPSPAATALRRTTTPSPAATALRRTTTPSPAATALRRTTTPSPAATALRRTTTTTPAATALRRTTTPSPAATALRRTTTPSPAATALRRTTTPSPAATALRRTTTPSPAATALRRTTTTTPAATALRRTRPTTTTTTTLLNSDGSNRATRNPNRLNNNRVAREIQNYGTQTRAISTKNTTGLFQGIEITCTKNTTIRQTNCSVTLQLKQRVSACCILSTLCAASQTSSDIRVVGKTADVIGPLLNECNSATQELNSCMFTGEVGASCEVSGSAFVVPQRNLTHCGADKKNNTCSCSAYCSGTDAYYTFKFLKRGSQMNLPDIFKSVMSKLEQHTNCPSSTDVSCPLSIIASEIKGATLVCEHTATTCMGILRFSREVPICNLSAAVFDAFQSEKEISFNGQVTRAAICGNSIIIDSPLPSSLMPIAIEVDIKPSSFCTAIEESHDLTCPNGKNVVVQLDEQCVVSPQPNNTTSAESQARALLELTRDVSKLNSSQVAQLVSQLENLLSGPNISLALGNISVHIVSNLLGASPEVLSDSSNRIIGIVDTVGLKLVLGGAAETLLSPSVALSVKPADGSNFQETFFSISDPNNVQVRGDSRRGRSLRDSSIPQGSIRLPPSLIQDLTDEQQQLATRVQFNFYQESTVYQDRALGNRILNSGIIGASVYNLSITELQDDVVIHLRHSEPVPANFVATCVYWDVTLNNKSGGWNPKGCFVRNSTDNETVCGCNHLTSFAILLDLSRQPVISREQATILSFITYIGCGISAIFLSITLLTYLAFGKLRKDIPSKILIQLCLALLLLNLVFLVDAWLSLYRDAVGLCISTAWFLHYFLLVTFTWMGLEAVHMYQALVKVFNSHISRYMLKMSLVGWGVPMIVVIIVIAIDKDNYGLVSYGRFADGTTDDFCWLRNDIAFYVAVVAYFCIIFLFNVVMFVVVLVQLCRIKRQNPHNVQHRTTLQDVRSVAGIMILLGLTWGFAFFAWGPLNLAFMYLFAIFNSLQGFFIFVFYCAVKENVRKQWRTYLCCGRMRLAENSEWSRTATQKTVKRSSVSRLTSSKSSQSNNSSLSFLVSDSSEQINGIGNPLEDRTITADEEPSMDVVLNEINSQSRNQQAP